MQNSNLLKGIILVLAFLPFVAYTQNFYSYTTKGSCHQLDNGRLDIQLIEQAISPIVNVEFPITIHVEDVNDDQVES